MEKVKGIDLEEVGHKRVITGMILGGTDTDNPYMVMLPGEAIPKGSYLEEFKLDEADWEKLLYQMDTLQVEVTQGKHLPKVVLRKSQRNIEQSVSWTVYKRDGYKCRYCGVDNVPLTVDHLRLWEEGGPSIEPNLVSSCKKCNRTRGNTPYEDWIKSPYYQGVSKNLTQDVRDDNEALIESIKEIKLTQNKRKR